MVTAMIGWTTVADERDVVAGVVLVG